MFLFFTVSRPAQGPSQAPNQWVPGTLFLWVKWAGHEADHSLPSGAKIKNAWRFTSALPYAFKMWGLMKHTGNFTFTLPNTKLQVGRAIAQAVSCWLPTMVARVQTQV
jgi:hypothetical protein